MSDSCSVTRRSLTLAFDRLVSCGLRRDSPGVCVCVPDCVRTPTSDCVRLCGGGWSWECAGEGALCRVSHPLGAGTVRSVTASFRPWLHTGEPYKNPAA